MDFRSKVKLKILSYKVKFILDSGLFDISWYTRMSGKNFASVDSAIRHYLSVGSAAGFNPNALFDVISYRNNNPDVVRASVDPLIHYARSGGMEARDTHPLFHAKFYLQQNEDVAKAGVNPLAHFLLYGGLEGRDPSPLFRSQYYLDRNPDVAAAGINPLVHYLSSGWQENRDPHPLFRTRYYLTHNQDVAAAGVNPLVHYMIWGGQEGRSPHPLFDGDYYQTQQPELKASGVNPLMHYITHKGAGYAKPHFFFDDVYYASQVNRSFEGKVSPLEDYICVGAGEGKNPHPLFDSRYYLDQAAAAGEIVANPLEDYVVSGASRGKRPNSIFDASYYVQTYLPGLSDLTGALRHYIEIGAGLGYLPAKNFVASVPVQSNDIAVNPLVLHLERERKTATPGAVAGADYVPPVGLLPWFDPLNVAIIPALATTPRLNVLLPWVSMRSMSGGPNTALNFAYRLAALGVPLRFVSANLAPDSDHEPILEHCRNLSGISKDVHVDIEIVDGSDHSKPLCLGENDIFFATAWWTAQMAHYATQKTNVKTFFYFIQDYEAILHEGSTQQALSLESYSFDIIPIFNTKLLRDYFVENKIGIFKEENVAEAALYFEPAIDVTKFFHVPRKAEVKRRLLFYARPTYALRNLFELGLAALQKIISDGVVNPDEWEFVAMGEPINPYDLGKGAQLVPAPWLGFEEYARQMRESDVLLSLMQSPHPSYPPIEFAACGKPVVTSEFSNKSAEALQALSPNILAALPSVEELSKALALAVARTYLDEKPVVKIEYPSTWDEAFEGVLPDAYSKLAALMGLEPIPETARLPWVPASRYVPGFDKWPTTSYAFQRLQDYTRRLARFPRGSGKSFSFLTTVWNTKPEYLYALAETVFSQNSGADFEWIILDNGTSDAGSLSAIEIIAKHASVKLYRVDENLGIIGGMRYVLERATRRYVIPLDSDDLLSPDCLSVLDYSLREAGYPALAYTDEDKIMHSEYRDPYIKPDWDPVLFYHSCYIAHLCVIDRKLLLDIGGYTDAGSTGSHDWDTFTRFHQAGYTPLHIAEMLYTWRMHEMSTASNIDSKSYISSSHRNVLGRFINGSSESKAIVLEHSPMFSGTPDWRFVYTKAEMRPVVTIAFGGKEADPPIWTAAPLLKHDVVTIENVGAWDEWIAVAEDAATRGALIHLLSDTVEIDDPLWFQEAVSLMQVFPDAGIVGGRIHSGSYVQAADMYFAVGHGIKSPNVGRSIQDPGYFAQAWKPRSCDAVPARHCVVAADLLVETLKRVRKLPITLDGMALWLGRTAQAAGRRVIFSPIISARKKDLEGIIPSPSEVRAQALLNHLDNTQNSTVWPHRLGTSLETAYSIVSDAQRKSEKAALASSLAEARADEVAAYIARRMSHEGGAASRRISVLTSVWERTPPDLFQLTVKSLLEQDQPFYEWIILENGPVSDEIASILSALQRDDRIKRHKIAKNVGIMRAMKYCLDRAVGDIIVPMDADDLLVPDALLQVDTRLKIEQADFIYSDEVMLVGDNATAPYIRGAFDEVLNANDSYIWHLCAFDRTTAVKLGVYSDISSEYCHDWDTVSRFARSGAKIAYAPDVLYKWRVHQQSSSNSGSLNEGSIASVRNVLEQNIALTKKSELYRVDPFPLWRGAEQLAILRNAIKPTQTEIIILGIDRKVPPAPAVLGNIAKQNKLKVTSLAGALSANGMDKLKQHLKTVKAPFVLLVAEGCLIEDPNAFWEAMRLLEMHQRVGASGGRIYNSQGIVLAAGQPLDASSRSIPSWVGRHVSDAGPYALALKPQLVETLPSGLIMVRTELLRRVCDLLDSETASLFDVGDHISAQAEKDGYELAYSPLIQALEVLPTKLFRRKKVITGKGTFDRPRQRSFEAEAAVPKVLVAES